MSNFGFKDNLTEAVSAIQPRPIARAIDHAAVDRAATEAGFESREAVGHFIRQKPPVEPSQPFSMRLPRSVVQRFAAFADQERLSYPKALAKLLDMLEQR